MRTEFRGISLPPVVVLFMLILAAPATVARATHEPPQVTIVATDHHAAEAEMDTGVFTVSRTGGTEASLLVFYELSGTARNGVDYQEIPNTVTIPVGSTSASITIRPVNDTLVEGTETVVATLVPSPVLAPIEPYRVGFPGSDVILLADNDSPTPEPPHCTPVPEGIVSWWPAEGNASDVAGSNAGTLAGGASLGEGKVGQAFSFDGTDGSVSFGNTIGNFDTNDFTIEFWMRTTSARHESVIEKRPVCTYGSYWGIRIGSIPPWSGPGRLEAEMASDSAGTDLKAISAGRPINDGLFHHVAFVRKEGSIVFYIDGVLDVVSNVGNRVTTRINNASDFTVGRSVCVGVDETTPFTGQMDEISIYHRALSETEIQAIHHAGSAGKCRPNQPPRVVIVTPMTGAVFTAPTDILLGANAPDDGDVVSVEFFAGDKLIVNAAGPFPTPFGAWSASWTNPPPGEHILTARATDDLGAVGWSEPVRILVRSPDAPGTPLIAKGAVWKYLDSGSDQGTGWREPGFNDGEWKSGPAQLGFGDGDEATLLQRGEGDRGFVTYYFRRAFELANPDGVMDLSLRLLRDDGAVAYLNGREVFRSNMPDGPVTSATLAVQTVGGDDENQFHSVSVDPRLLVSGRNVLAVEVHQVSSASSDASFDAELVGGSIRLIPVVNIAAADAEGAEISPLVDALPNPAAFKVSRTGETNQALKVYYRLIGTARNGVDYTELPGFVTIPEGSTAVEILVEPIDDALVEGTESVVATLIPFFLVGLPGPTDPYIVGQNATAEAHILDDDVTPPNTLPQIRIVRPANGDVFTAGDSIELTAFAQDHEDGYMLAVEFLAGDRSLGFGTFNPTRCADICPNYILKWMNVPPGEYTLIAKATDKAGAVGISDPIRITVREGCRREIVVLPRATGTIRLLPEMGILEPAPVGDGIQSSYFRTTDRNREFRRGFIEFALPQIDRPILQATLILTEHRGWTSEPVPPDVHELSFYGADLTVNTNDYRRATMPFATLETDANLSQRSFAFDVTAPVSEFKGHNLGFRIKLSVDPTLEAFGSIGSGFHNNYLASPARIIIVTADECEGLLTITRPENGSTFTAPANVQIEATAIDPNGYISRVEFFANNEKIGVSEVVFIRPPDPGEPVHHSFNWQDVHPGSYALTAKATDTLGHPVASRAVSIRVVEAPPHPPVVNIVARDPVASEGTSFWNWEGHDLAHFWRTNTATFVVRRSGEANADLVVLYSTHGTARNGSDYESLPGSVAIPAGRRSARITVWPVDDELKEEIETVVLRLEPDPSLGPVPRYTVGEASRAAAIIVDNDRPRPRCARLPDGHFHLCAPGWNGQWFRIETSRDLLHWLPVCTNVVTEGAVHFVDPDAAGQERRFYRVLPETNVEADE